MPTISPSVVANIHYERKSAEHWNYEKLAIAAIVILSVLAVTAIIYLLIWYLRERRIRRYRQHSQEDHLFGQSTVSLADDASKALDQFLMTDVQPQRTSIARGPRRSPSITMVFEDAYLDSPPQPYMKGYDSSVSTLQVNATDLTPITIESAPNRLDSSVMAGPTSGKRSSNSTPRASVSSTGPYVQSSQVWATTNANADIDITTLRAQHSVRSRQSQIPTQSPTVMPLLRSSRSRTRRSIDLREVDRPSKVDSFRSGVQSLNEKEPSRRSSSGPPVPTSFRYSAPT